MISAKDSKEILNYFMYSKMIMKLMFLLLQTMTKSAFGDNSYGVLGFGYRYEIKELEINE
jgi:hypothetical protein